MFFVDNAKTIEHMKDKRVLYVSSEVVPYLPETEISSMSFEAPRMVNKQGGQIRIFMPRYGNINERRHQLHEVIRLSGINLVINDLDMPLIIKVASIQSARMQIYFIDNVKFHIDVVKELGTFVEIEAIGNKDETPKEILQEQCEYFMELLGIEKGIIKKGYAADLTILNLDCEEKTSKKNLVCQSKNSPFIGRRLFGHAKLTILEGKIVYNAMSEEV